MPKSLIINPSYHIFLNILHLQWRNCKCLCQAVHLPCPPFQRLVLPYCQAETPWGVFRTSPYHFILLFKYIIKQQYYKFTFNHNFLSLCLWTVISCLNLKFLYISLSLTFEYTQWCGTNGVIWKWVPVMYPSQTSLYLMSNLLDKLRDPKLN